MKTSLKEVKSKGATSYFVVDDSGKKIANLSETLGEELIDAGEKTEHECFQGIYSLSDGIEMIALFNSTGELICSEIYEVIQYVQQRDEFILLLHADRNKDAIAIGFPDESYCYCVINKYAEMILIPRMEKIEYWEYHNLYKCENAVYEGGHCLGEIGVADDAPYGVFDFIRNNKVGLIDKGEILVDAQYDDAIFSFEFNDVLFKRSGKVGFYNLDINKGCEVDYDQIKIVENCVLGSIGYLCCKLDSKTFHFFHTKHHSNDLYNISFEGIEEVEVLNRIQEQMINTAERPVNYWNSN